MPLKPGPRSFAPRASRTAATAALAAALLLASCGGDGGSDSSLPPSATFQGRFLGGSGAQAADWDAASCSPGRQKNWVRSNLNEDYLFYNLSPLVSLSPDAFAGGVPELFDAYTVDSVDQDRFSFVITQAEADAAFQAGEDTSVGIRLRRDPVSLQIRVATVEPNGPAAAAGVQRGMQLDRVNGAPLDIDAPSGQFVLSRAQADAIFFSPPGTSVTLGFSSPPSTVITNFSMSTATFAESPLLVRQVIEAAPDRRVGYLAHNSFSTPIGETQLADAFQLFADAAITDLVVDLRYNTGGFIFISSQLAYMVAGTARTAGKTYERFVFNDKRSGENTNEPFRDRITSFQAGNPRRGEALPQLNLGRIFVLSTADTCSASEAFISALRGVDVEVVMIGGATCGKPYGFSQENNCTLSFFPLEFEGRNHKGEVVPVTGLPPQCPAVDDLDHALGDTNERLLAGALFHIANGQCSPALAASAKRAQAGPRAKPAADRLFTPAARSIQLRTQRPL